MVRCRFEQRQLPSRAPVSSFHIGLCGWGGVTHILGLFSVCRLQDSAVAADGGSGRQNRVEWGYPVCNWTPMLAPGLFSLHPLQCKCGHQVRSDWDTVVVNFGGSCSGWSDGAGRSSVWTP